MGVEVEGPMISKAHSSQPSKRALTAIAAAGGLEALFARSDWLVFALRLQNCGRSTLYEIIALAINAGLVVDDDKWLTQLQPHEMRQIEKLRLGLIAA